MADEIQYSISTRYRAGAIKDDTPAETFKVTQANLRQFNSKGVMAANSGDIRAGGAFVEIGVQDKVRRGLARVQAQLRALGRFVTDLGKQFLKVGATLTAALALPVKAAADFEQVLLQIRAAANPTARQMQRIREEALRLSEATGAGPTEVAQAMKELVKAGLSVEQVLGGAGCPPSSSPRSARWSWPKRPSS